MKASMSSSISGAAAAPPSDGLMKSSSTANAQSLLSPDRNPMPHGNYESTVQSHTFNIGGDKLKILEKVLRKFEENKLRRPATANGVSLRSKTAAQERSAKLMAEKRELFIKNRFESSGISDTMKRCILGEDGLVMTDLELGFPPNSRDPKTGRAILHEACLSGNINMARMLITQFKADVMKTTTIGLETPLHMAVLSDHRQLCVTLCLMGADPNARNKQKLTPLFYAKSRRVLKALLHHGCNPLLVNKSGETALDYLTRLKGPDDWDFGMRELLQEAMDARMRGIHHEKEARRRLDVAQREAEDDLSSLNSSLASLLPAPFRSTAARARKEGSSNALEQLSKSVDSSPFGKKARRR